ncbi:hypothetical protein [Methanosaeta sp. UBA356]|jgi:hypothetical protein|uniref:hypothetical protein n=1 Tax=Methanosaeta sp. UBA356 TaxID=1915559 RepID=UPI00257A7EBC|nr:hypothetical protein [Methanosaeta sp. UBA356]
MVQFEQDEMEIMRKSGQVVGKIANNYISDLYQLDRIRSAEELIKQLKNISLRAISMGKKSDDSIYTEPLANLMDLVNRYKSNFDEIKDIVIVYSTFYLGAIRYSK